LSAPSDLLSIVLKSWENEEFDLEDMIDDFITFFIAGQETTANTLAFCIIELSKKEIEPPENIFNGFFVRTIKALYISPFLIFDETRRLLRKVLIETRIVEPIPAYLDL
jgi:hypothetical protein